MTHTFKLSRRIARLRPLTPLFGLAVIGACGGADALGPSDVIPPSSSASNPAPGIPFGAFGLPAGEYANVAWTGSLKHLWPGSSALADLASAKQHGVRMIVSLAGGRDGYKNADGTFSLTKWKTQIDAWRSIDLDPYIADGTIIGHYLMDEPNWAGGWGGKTVSKADLDEMARYSKSIWPTLATTVRVHAGYLIGHPWRHLDFAWAQWEGPLHEPSFKMTPEAFRDQQVADARAAGLGLMFGMNVLDGGDGSSGIAGTYDLDVVKTRWQMSAAEIERVGKVLAAAPYACGVMSWRWSPEYPAYYALTPAQLTNIRKFNHRTDVKTALSRVASTARNRATTSCQR